MSPSLFELAHYQVLASILPLTVVLTLPPHTPPP